MEVGLFERRVGFDLLHGGVVGVAFFVASVERGAVVIGEGGVGFEAFDEVGVGDGETAEGDEVGLGVIQENVGAFLEVAAGRDKGAFEKGAPFFGRKREAVGGDVVVAEHAGLDEVEVGEPVFVEPLDSVFVKGLGIGGIDVVEGAGRGKAKADAFRPFGGDGVEDFEEEAGTVLDGAAVFVFAFVAVFGEKLVDEVAVGTMDFDTIKTGFAGGFGGLAVILDGEVDVVGGHLLGLDDLVDGGEVGLPDFDLASADGRGRGRKLIFGLIGRVGNAAAVPELAENESACFVDGGGDLFPALDLLGGVDAGGGGVAVAGRVDGGGFGEDEAHGGALAIVFHHEVGGDVAFAGAVTGEGGHHDAVRQGETGGEFKRFEKFHFWANGALSLPV